MAHCFVFGIFDNGRLVMALGKAIRCTHDQAALIVAILDAARLPLEPGHYVACDYHTQGEVA